MLGSKAPTHRLKFSKSIRYLVLFFTCVSWSTIVYAQESTTIDSLLNQLEKAESRASRIPTLLKLSNIYSGRNPTKSAEYAKQILLDSVVCTNDQLTRAYHSLGYAYFDQNILDTALVQFENALRFSKKLEDKTLELRIGISLSDCNRYYGNFNAAFEHAFEALRIADAADDYTQLGNLNNKIGELYREQTETDKAVCF